MDDFFNCLSSVGTGKEVGFAVCGVMGKVQRRSEEPIREGAAADRKIRAKGRRAARREFEKRLKAELTEGTDRKQDWIARPKSRKNAFKWR